MLSGSICQGQGCHEGKWMADNKATPRERTLRIKRKGAIGIGAGPKLQDTRSEEAQAGIK